MASILDISKCAKFADVKYTCKSESQCNKISHLTETYFYTVIFYVFIPYSQFNKISHLEKISMQLIFTYLKENCNQNIKRYKK